MRFVFDTNTLISAILKPNGIVMQVVNVALQKGIIVFSADTKAEIVSVIQRDKFNKYLSLAERLKAVENIFAKGMDLDTKTTDLIMCRDFSDVKFLRLAFEAKADCIISGDADLKVLNPFRGIPIFSITEFSSFISPFNFLLHYYVASREIRKRFLYSQSPVTPYPLTGNWQPETE